MKVKVANGVVIRSQGSCSNVATKVQGSWFSPSYCVLSLAGCDVVLGVQWLETLGPIMWYFSNLHMAFQWEGSHVSLMGLKSTRTSFVEGNKMELSSFTKGKAILLQLISNEVQEIYSKQ